MDKELSIQWIVYVADGDDEMTNNVGFAFHIMLPYGSTREDAVKGVRDKIENVYESKQYDGRKLQAFMISTINHGHLFNLQKN